MEHKLSRRGFIRAAASAAAAAPILNSAARPAPAQTPAPAVGRRSVVALVEGQSRRKNVHDALAAIEEQIVPVLKRKKYVVIKPNLVSTVNQLAATHADALRGILDFLEPRFKGPVVIAESSAGYTRSKATTTSATPVVAREFKSRQVSLVDLNEEARYELSSVIDADLHVVPVRLAARLLDPEAFILCAAVMKTHNVVVATLSIKNMTLGAPLHNPRKESKRWNDKRLYHGGVRQTHVDMLLTAQKMQPFWGATVIDGYEGMEGNGPSSGLPVPSRIAIASTDYVAADRVGRRGHGDRPRLDRVPELLRPERARAVRSREDRHSRRQHWPRSPGSTSCTRTSSASCSGWAP